MSYSELIQKINRGQGQGEIVRRFARPEILSWLAEIDKVTGQPKGEVLLDGRNRVVALKLPVVLGEEEEVVVKHFRLRGLAKVRAALVWSKARRAFYGALALKQAGIATPEPFAYLTKKGRCGPETEYYIALRVRGKEEVRVLFRTLPEPELLALLRDLARFLRQLHGCQFIHRDLSDGNVLASRRTGDSWDFCLLDTNRVRKKKKITRYLGLKNLVRLGIPGRLQSYFIQNYLQTTNLPRLAWLWYRFQKLSYTSWVRAKKFLRLRALAQRLKIQ
ncbi:MAG: lipopolysaccharide kinase InaA family protein [Candidatus Aminicenantales bacterium]